MSSSSTEALPEAQSHVANGRGGVRVRLDRHARRLGRFGEVLVGGAPFRIVRLSRRGTAVLDAWIASDGGVAASGGKADDLRRRLIGAGLVHPVIEPQPVAASEVAIVIPVRNDVVRLDRLLTALRRDFDGCIVVVDDGSRDANATDAVATTHSAAIVHRPDSVGPAAARNAARRFILDEQGKLPWLLAFVDSDVLPEASWLPQLAGHFADPEVGAVAPRVRTNPVPRSRLADYEDRNSPLDLGPEGGIVGAHRKLSYVPSACLVCRGAALEEVGWFDAKMRVGEDVDLVRRLEAAGWQVRYESAAIVRHDSRSSLWRFARQRFSYGLSAAVLDARHPGTVPPFESGSWSLAGLAGGAGVLWSGLGGGRMPVLVRRALAGSCAAVWLAATALPVAKVARQLRVGGGTVAATAIVVRGQISAAVGLLTAIRRVWWAPIFLGILVTRRLRRLNVSLFVLSQVGRLLRWRRGASRLTASTLVSDAGFGLVDDIAYGAGVWVGCARAQRWGPVLPITTKPRFTGVAEPGKASRG